MPRFEGPVIPGTHEANEAETGSMVKLTYPQACKLPASAVRHRINKTDKGGPGRRAVHRFNWYVTPNDIIACQGATRAMVLAAAKTIRCGVTDPHGVTHVPASSCVHRRSGRLVLIGRAIDCMTCLVLEARGE